MPGPVMGGTQVYGGSAIAVLEDPGDAWEPNTAVTEGHRIAEIVQGRLRVFEAAGAGTTGDLSGFTDLTINLLPLGLTSDDDFSWRYLGIAGELSWEVAPLRSEFGVDDSGPYIAGHEPISEANTTFRILAALGDPGNTWEADTEVQGDYRITVSIDNALRVFQLVTPGTTGASQPAWNIDTLLNPTPDGTVTWSYLGIVGQPDTQRVVFTTNSAGDADWFLDVNNSSGFRFNLAVDGVGDTGLGFIEITTDGFMVARGGSMFQVQLDPFAIIVHGLPTSDPVVDGQLWRSGNDMKISTG